ncbi:MAG: transposase [Paracoccaceae bacterium]|jgi:transposase
MPDFMAVEVSDAPKISDIDQLLPEARIEIMLENGRKLSISNGVDAGFGLELARGLAA